VHRGSRLDARGREACIGEEPDSNREEKLKGPSQVPLPSFMVPAPSFNVPFHSAEDVLTAIVPSMTRAQFPVLIRAV